MGKSKQDSGGTLERGRGREAGTRMRTSGTVIGQGMFEAANEFLG